MELDNETIFFQANMDGTVSVNFFSVCGRDSRCTGLQNH
jgi:hypothetical protein